MSLTPEFRNLRSLRGPSEMGRRVEAKNSDLVRTAVTTTRLVRISRRREDAVRKTGLDCGTVEYRDLVDPGGVIYTQVLVGCNSLGTCILKQSILSARTEGTMDNKVLVGSGVLILAIGRNDM